MNRRHFPDSQYLFQLASQAGEIMTSNFQLGMVRELKEDDTPLTKSDTAINKLVIESLHRDFPHIRVISEEGCNDVGDAEYTVYCDPVDGTIPFSLGVPISTFCISVVHNRRAIVGLIHDPFQHRTWHATREDTRGGVAWIKQNGCEMALKVSQHNSLKSSNVAMCWWKGSPYNLHGVCQKLMDAGGKWMNSCSIAYFGGLIASGEFDASIFPGQKSWETSAMQVIVEEAGGIATNIYGNQLQYNGEDVVEGHVISNGVIHDELLKIIQDCQ